MSEILHIYTRVSTLVQADEGMSLDFQRELGIKRAKELGFKYRVWNEGGKSSNHEEIDKRPVLSQLFNEIKRGVVKHLFVYDQSRLSRNDTVSSIFRIECAKQGLTLYNKEGKYNLSDHNDHFMKQILDAVGQFDNAQRAERTRLGKLAKVRQGYWQGGPPPFGYEIKDRKLAVKEDEAKWVRVIFERYARKVSTLDIKIELDRNGVEPRRRRGNWTLGSLQALMRNTHYIGYYDFEDSKSEDEVRVQCPRIISSDLWIRVKATREEYIARRHSENPIKHFYLLKNILRCAHCGTWLSGIYSKRQTKNHYYCPKKERVWSKRPIAPEDKWKRGRVCEMTRSLNIEATDQLVWNSVIDALGRSSLMKETIRTEFTGANGELLQVSAKESKARDGRIKQLQKLVAKLEDSLVELEADRLMGKVTPSQYPQIKAKISEEKTGAEAEIERLQQLILGAHQQKSWIDWVGKFQRKIEQYHDFSRERRRELLQGLLTSIEVHLMDQQTHWLEINFKIPLVGDGVLYNDPSKKAKGYKVIEGQTVQMIELVSRPYTKKKPTAIGA